MSAVGEPAMATFTSRDGTEIVCQKSGAGPPLVLVHGTTADRSRWAPVRPLLEARFTLYACDRRGRGASGDGPAYALEREAEDVVAVVDGIGGPVDLVAHSYGAVCALEAAPRARHLRRLVLYEPPINAGRPVALPDLHERLLTLLEAGDRAGVVATFLEEVARVPAPQLERLRRLPASHQRVSVAATIPREVWAQGEYVLEPERFRGLEAPVLLLLGGASPPFFRAALDRVQAAVPRAELVVLPGQTHGAIDLVPELFAREVIGFLTR
jgi:pimeloyl-ACP methyl ester carboxylesterase